MRTRTTTWVCSFALLIVTGFGQADPATEFLIEAQRLQQAGRLDAAGVAFGRALALQPQNPKVYLAASRFYEKVGKPQDCLVALISGIRMVPKDFSLRVEAGFIYAALLNYARAAEQFEAARTIDPSSADNLFNLANAHLKAAADAFRRERWEESRAHVEKALQVGQPLPRLNYLAGKVYFQRREAKKALPFLARAAQEEPGQWEIQLDYGIALSVDNRWKEAADQFTRVIALNAASAPAHLYLGRAMHELNMSEKSVPLFEKAVKLDPTLRLAHYHLGFALKGLGQIDRARQELQSEVLLNPDYSLPYFELGLIAQEKGNSKEALDYLQKAQARQPVLPRAQYEMAKVLSDLGSYGEAIAAYQAFLKLEPASIDGHYGLYRALLRAGRQEESERILAEYNRLKSQRPQ